uniref:Putative ovule protein n=1 Tax=Solanum chacoense TaxID=4108 RepID=A0A0V0GT07_SOLCH
MAKNIEIPNHNKFHQKQNHTQCNPTSGSRRVESTQTISLPCGGRDVSEKPSAQVHYFKIEKVSYKALSFFTLITRL